MSLYNLDLIIILDYNDFLGVIHIFYFDDEIFFFNILFCYHSLDFVYNLGWKFLILISILMIVWSFITVLIFLIIPIFVSNLDIQRFFMLYI